MSDDRAESIAMRMQECPVQRILIIGPCGAGKSTLAFELGTRLDLPVYHMDQLNWQANWVESSKDAIRARLSVITSTDRWLIDGNYGGTLPERLTRADTVIYLDYPVPLCVYRVVRRIIHYRGRTRPDMTSGCPERFDLAFLWYLARWNSGPRQRTESHLNGHEGKIVRLRKPLEMKRWLATL